MSTIITVEHLSKQYRIGTLRRHNSFRDVFDEKLSSLFKRSGTQSRNEENYIWALSDVSFEVQQGDVFGIIGRNGAGKSTLLKVLSRITEPTKGTVRMRGRVASLLEVGTGFSGELSGRENIFLNGAILGMKRAEIIRKFDEIVSFAEVEKFIDTPMKQYSSGMYMRLAFAVAAHLEPEILIVDEVLAVGDAAFQKKCLGKMEEVGREGRTILFVSHNMEAVLSLCKTAVLISDGKILDKGNVARVVERYIGDKLTQEDTIDLAKVPRKALYRKIALLTGARLLSKQKNGPWLLPFGNNIILGVSVKLQRRVPWLEFSVALKTITGFEIASTLSPNYLPKKPMEPGEYYFKLTYKHLFLTPGIYRFGFGLKTERGLEDYLPEALDLEIVVSEKSAGMDTHKVQGTLIPQVGLNVSKSRASAISDGALS
ncbi:MAG: polysaccharide ABC transporter ATP-binding protein [Bacteroidota bacterium]